jgi:aminopeptidase N
LKNSFDEPNLKATFDFSIEVPEHYTALSNQPEKESVSIGNGLKKVSFVTAPKMSTYVCRQLSEYRPHADLFGTALCLGMRRV